MKNSFIEYIRILKSLKKSYLKALLSCFFSNPAGPVPPPETDPDRRPEVEDIEDVDVERLELAV